MEYNNFIELMAGILEPIGNTTKRGNRTIRGFAAYLGIAIQSVRNWKYEKRVEPSMSNFLMVAKELGYSTLTVDIKRGTFKIK